MDWNWNLSSSIPSSVFDELPPLMAPDTDNTTKFLDSDSKDIEEVRINIISFF